MPNSEEFRVEAIVEVHLKMHNGIVRKLGDVRCIPKMIRNLISLMSENSSNENLHKLNLAKMSQVKLVEFTCSRDN